ncbi:MAG: methyltransferase domain-containing protein [Ilumatobacter sp.]|nr:methyltransferase domain-containing protein [Ilumatobacter sp.]
MITAVLKGAPPVRFEFWDGSSFGPEDAPGTLAIRSADALRRIVWAPGELGFGRAFVVGDVDIEGNVARVLRALQTAMPGDVGVGLAALPVVADTARKLGVIGAPLPPPPEEHNPRGLRHSISRDKDAVSHHYDVGNDFYALVLGPSMTYSCARFVTPDTDLAAAQAAKHDLICRKLGLGEAGRRQDGVRPRLLDVGCGWGSMAIHAASTYDVDVVGVTISDEQARLARKRVAEAGMGDRVEIRIQDYREVGDGPYDAISSIGMAEHVGKKRMEQYFTGLWGQLRPGGRMMNHAIGSIGGSKLSSRSFVGRYVFPDGELLDLADTILAMQAAGFEVRDVENLREHYATTLDCWVANLEADWEAAIGLVGERRARVWQLYMSGSINGFYDGGLQLYQTLGVKAAEGRSLMPATRADWG